MGIDIAAFLDLSFPTVDHELAWRQATAREAAYKDVGDGLLAPLGKGRKRVAQTLAALRDNAATGHFSETAEDAQYRLELVMPGDSWEHYGSPLHAAARVAAEHEGTGALRIIGFEGTDYMVVVEITPGRSNVRAPTKAERKTSERAIQAIRGNLVATAEEGASKAWTPVSLDREGIRAQVQEVLGHDWDGDAFRALMGAGEGASQVILDALVDEMAHPTSDDRSWASALGVIWRRGERATGARHLEPLFERARDDGGSKDLRLETAYAIVTMRDPAGLQFVARAFDGLVASWKRGTDDSVLEPVIQAVLLLDPARAFEHLAPLSLPTAAKKKRHLSHCRIFPAFALQDWSTRSPLGRAGGVLEPRDPRWNDHLASWLDSDVPEAWEKVTVGELLLRFGDARGLDALIAALDHDEPLQKNTCDTLARLGDTRAAAALRAAGRRNKQLQRAYYATAKTIEERL